MIQDKTIEDLGIKFVEEFKTKIFFHNEEFTHKSDNEAKHFIWKIHPEFTYPDVIITRYGENNFIIHRIQGAANGFTWVVFRGKLETDEDLMFILKNTDILSYMKLI